MKIKYILSPLLCLLVIACGSDSKSKKAPGAEEVPEPVFKASDCLSGPTARSIEGTWHTAFASENFSYELFFEFDNGMVAVTNVCTVNQIDVEAYVKSSYSVNGDEIRVLGKKFDSTDYDDGETTINCEVGLEAKPIKYDLRGSCLVFIDDNGQSLYLKPVL